MKKCVRLEQMITSNKLIHYTYLNDTTYCGYIVDYRWHSLESKSPAWNVNCPICIMEYEKGLVKDFTPKVIQKIKPERLKTED